MIARRNEQKELNDAFTDERSQFVAVYGRRRVGKTFLVKETFEGRFSFRHTGLANADKKQQIAAFKKSLKKAGMRSFAPIADWYAAFDLYGGIQGFRKIARDEVVDLSPRDLNFVCHALNLNMEDTRCYKQAQLRKARLNS